MAKSKKKLDSKSFAQHRRTHRRWVTFMRMCRYGVNNFTRNAWLTIAATAVMTITLFIVFMSFSARNILIDTLGTIQNDVRMSLYLANETPADEVSEVTTAVRELSTVEGVTVISPETARENFINQNREDEDALEAIKEATNKFPWTLNIKVKDINNTQELATFVADNEFAKERLDPNQPPSFAGNKKGAIDSIASAIDFAQKVGIGASVIFVLISTLIIFNTIRMAIFNRREEIQMMKLIGAEKSFIRGPFVVEAIVYGFFAAIIATAAGYALLYVAAPRLVQQGITIQPTLDLITFYAGFVLLAMITVGAIIGIISSLMATRRHLKL